MIRILLILTIIGLPVASIAGKVTPDSLDDKATDVVENQPVSEGILGWMLNFIAHDRAWYHVLFADTDALDHLALAATDHRADRVVPNNVSVVIEDQEELRRFFELHHTFALTHIVEIEFALGPTLLDGSPEATLLRILEFLGKNAHLLRNLDTIEFLVLKDRREENLVILKAALTDKKLRALFLQTSFFFHVCFCNQLLAPALLNNPDRLTDFFPVLALLELDPRLQKRVLIELDANGEITHRELLAVLGMTNWRFSHLRSLGLRGETFDDDAVSVFVELLEKGMFRGLSALELVNTNLSHRGLRSLAAAFTAGFFRNLVTFHFEDQDFEGAFETQPDAISQLHGLWRAHATLKEFTFISNALIDVVAFRQFFNKFLKGQFYVVTLSRMTLVGLEDAHLEALCQLAHLLQSLEVLNLRGNPALTQEAIIKLQKALPNCQILCDQLPRQVLNLTVERPPGEDDQVYSFFRY